MAITLGKRSLAAMQGLCNLTTLRVEVGPRFTSFDFSNSRKSNVVSRRDLLVLTRVRDDSQCLSLTQLGARISSATRPCSVPAAILEVFQDSAVLKIIRSIVRRPAVFVANNTRFGGGAVKSQSNQAVDGMKLYKPVHAKRNAPILAPHPRLKHDGFSVVDFPLAWNIAAHGAYPARRTGFIKAFVARYPFPNLIGIIGVSHSEIILRCGQGLALLTQRLRPALDSRFASESQGVTA